MTLVIFLEDLTAIVLLAALILLIVRSQREALWREAFRRLRKNRLAVGATVVLCIYVGLGFLDSISFRTSKTAEPQTIVDTIFKRSEERSFSAPLAKTTSGELVAHPLIGLHLMGTDSVGADTMYETVKGIRTALIIGALSCAIAVPVALLFGMLAGYYGKFTDDAVQYTYTVFGSVPDILLIIALVMMLGHSIFSICFALGLTSWINLCRLVRGETLKHRDRDYVRAAKALGVSDARILVRHIMPNLLPAVIIAVTLLFSSLALYEAILAYLGVGLPPDAGSWGNMINSSRTELTRDPAVWWNLVFAAGGLLVLVLSLNILADALRDAIDSRLRTE